MKRLFVLASLGVCQMPFRLHGHWNLGILNNVSKLTTWFMASASITETVKRLTTVSLDEKH